MAEGYGQRISLVLTRWRRKRQQHAHHVLHLHLIRAARTDHRELDGFGAVFMHIQAALEAGTENGAARLPEFERCRWVTGKDELFHRHFVRLIVRHQSGHAIKNQLQTLWPTELTNTNAATGDTAALASITVNNAEARVARARVNPQNAVSERRWRGHNRLGIQLRHDVIADIGVVIDILHIIKIIERINELEQFFCRVAVELNIGRRIETDLRDTSVKPGGG